MEGALQLVSFVMSKTDLDQMIIRGQEQNVFQKCRIALTDTMVDCNSTDARLLQEEYEDYLQCLAQKHFLEIVRLDRETIGD